MSGTYNLKFLIYIPLNYEFKLILKLFFSFNFPRTVFKVGYHPLLFPSIFLFKLKTFCKLSSLDLNP